MSNLKKNSPFKRGESVAGIADWLNYGSIAQAGQPVSLGGEAVIQLGALFSQLDFKPKGEASSEETDSKDKAPNLDEIFKVDPEKLKVKQQTLPPADLSKIIIGGRLPDRPELTTKKESKPTTSTPPPTSETFGSLLVDPATGKTPGTFEGKSSLLEPEESFYQYVPRGSFAPGAFPRLSSETLNALNGLRYTNKDKNDTPLRRVMHAVSSPFLQTDNLSYGQIKQAVMPEYAKGRLGTAAAEGFNLVIDKYNYDQAVKKDYEKELDDEMGDLVVPADFVSDTARKNYLEFSLGKKKKVAEAFNDYANGRISKLDYENLKASVKSEIDQAAVARTNLAKLREEFVKNKGTYDIGASNKEMVDFYNTLEKNPEALSIVTKDGIDYITGTTRNDKFIQVPTSKIASGVAGFRLVEKASTAPIAAGALKAIDQYKEEVKTRYGIGQADADPETAKKIGVNYIKNQLKDETKLRSVMSQVFGVDHTAFQQFIENDETLSAEMLNDAAEELYDMSVAPQYFPQQKTTRVIQPRAVSATAAERAQQQIVNKIKTLGELNEKTLSKYNSAIPPNMREKGYRVAYKNGNPYIVRPDKKGELKGTPFSMETYSQILGTKPGALPILNK
jgi:hypothetical protein